MIISVSLLCEPVSPITSKKMMTFANTFDMDTDMNDNRFDITTIESGREEPFINRYDATIMSSPSLHEEMSLFKEGLKSYYKSFDLHIHNSYVTPMDDQVESWSFLDDLISDYESIYNMQRSRVFGDLYCYENINFETLDLN